MIYVIIITLGEFGIVFKAHLFNRQGDKLPKAVAVKTVKGIYLE